MTNYLQDRFDKKNLEMIYKGQKPTECKNGDCEKQTNGTLSEFCIRCLDTYCRKQAQEKS